MITDLRTRYLVIKLILNGTQFPGSTEGSNIKIIRGSSDYNSLSIDAIVNQASGFMNFNATVTIYGMKKDDIYALTKVNFDNIDNLYNNGIEIYAGYELDSDNLPPLLYTGQIRMAVANFNDVNRPFTIVSQNGIVYQNTIANATNIKGKVTLNNLFSAICQHQQGLIYTPYQVTGNTLNPIYKGSAIEQLRQATYDHGYQVKFNNNNALVSPVGMPFVDITTQIDVTNGLLGYPTSTDLGINIKTRFNPKILFGQKIQLYSVLSADSNAPTYNNNGTEINIYNNSYYINGLEHNLQTKGANWFSNLKLNYYQVQPGEGILRE